MICLFGCQTRMEKAQQDSEFVNKVKKFQKELNREYANKNETPLRGQNYMNFKGHPFFPVNSKYLVVAKLTKVPVPKPFELPTSSGRTRTYQEFGTIKFLINEQSYTLTVYQNLALIKEDKYKNHLFLPFRDATNGKETYGGGKYIDLEIPKGDEIIIDFNQSYHPFCAYNAYDYNCPIVPEKNILPIEIKAGVMYEDKYFEH